MEEITPNDFKIKQCLICGAKTDPKDCEELFCSKCGAPVINFCSDYRCGKPLKGDALYCKHCGSESTFKNYGLFSTPSSNLNDDDLPF